LAETQRRNEFRLVAYTPFIEPTRLERRTVPVVAKPVDLGDELAVRPEKVHFVRPDAGIHLGLALQSLCFRVLRFTHRQLKEDRSTVVAALRDLLGQSSLAPNL
jgi:hypothetical protein